MDAARSSRSRALPPRGSCPTTRGSPCTPPGRDRGRVGPLLEVGSYCGKSAVYLGAAARAGGTVLFSVDHHRGSEENQAGWEHHDPEVVDPETGRMDTLPFFRRTIERAGLEDVVVAVVGDSPAIAAALATPLGLVFVDGGHALDVVLADYEGWSPHVAAGGLLVFHDVFEDPPTAARRRSRFGSAPSASGRFDARSRRPAACVVQCAVLGLVAESSRVASAPDGDPLGFDLGAGGQELLGGEPEREALAAEQPRGRPVAGRARGRRARPQRSSTWAARPG